MRLLRSPWKGLLSCATLAASVSLVGCVDPWQLSSQRASALPPVKLTDKWAWGAIKGMRGGWCEAPAADAAPSTGEALEEEQPSSASSPPTSEPVDASTELVAESPEDEAAPAGPPPATAPAAALPQPEEPTAEGSAGASEPTTPSTSTTTTAQQKKAAAAVRSASGPSGASSDQYNARIPWLITSRMRRILIDELHYLPEEVDAMSASVATVVVNKRLERPSKGMPAAFRKDYQLSPKEKIRSRLQSAVAAIKKHRWKAVAGLAGSALVVGLAVGLALREGDGEEGGGGWWWQGEEEEEEEEDLPWLSQAVVRLRESLPLGSRR